ncbi:MAG: PKD domain-containing protein [Prevotella sp.]|nr:PKD domain-containing protein [Prevotella sp.]
MKHIKYIFLSIVALAIASCGKEMTVEEITQKLPEPKVNIEISNGTGSELRVNRTQTIYPTWNFGGEKVNWRTSNDNVVITDFTLSSISAPHSVSVKGVAQGKSIVTAEIGGYEGSVEVEVLPLADFTIKQTSGTRKMTYTFVAQYYEFYRAEWSFGNGNTYSQYSDSKYDGVYTTYASSGIYNVTLSLYDKNSKLIDSYTKSVTVE